MSDYLNKIAWQTKLVVSIFYLVGVIGMLLPFSSSLFLYLIPFALFFSCLVLVVFHEGDKLRRTLLVFLFIYFLTFCVEVLGVNWGFIFGAYEYGTSLGYKMFNTPIIIGLNWLVLVYITATVLEYFKLSVLSKIVLASLLMLVYDIILEKVAPSLDMWFWKGDEVPFQNYLSWFIISLVLHSIVKSMRIKLKNKMAAIVLISQMLFFLILACFL